MWSIVSSSGPKPCSSFSLRILCRVCTLAMLGGLFGCGSLPSMTRQQIYQQLEGATGVNRAPVVIVPGALGSVLEKRYPNEPRRGVKPIWGGLSALLTKNFEEMEMNIQIKTDDDLLRQPDLSGEVYSKRILGRIALPWYLRWSLEIVRGQQGEYDLLVERLLDLGYWASEFGFKDQAMPEVVEGSVCPGDNLFVFYYDWRRDIVTLAARLELFLEAVVQAIKTTEDAGGQVSCKREGGKVSCVRREPADCKEKAGRSSLFDPKIWDERMHLITHSMGGLIAKYYFAFGGQPLDPEKPLRFDEGAAKRIDTLFLIGVPSRGSLATFRYALEGYDEFLFKTFVDLNVSRRVLSSFPATYQLMPFGNFDVVVEQREGPVNVNDFYSPAKWQEHRWGIYDPNFRQYLTKQGTDNWERFLKIALDRAWRVHAALRKAEIQLRGRGLMKRVYHVGGDCFPTPLAMRGDRWATHFPEYDEVGNDRDMRSRLFFPGDGRVTIRSLMELDSPTDPVTFENTPVFHCESHANLYKDDGVQDHLLTILHRLKGR